MAKGQKRSTREKKKPKKDKSLKVAPASSPGSGPARWQPQQGGTGKKA
jgi:hypothetical protein